MVKKLILIFILTRFILFFFPWILRFLHFEESTYQSFFEYLYRSWSFWDAPHFLYIAQNWYTSVGDPANFIVFFPMYPLLVAGMLSVIKMPEIAGIAVSFISSVLMVGIFYKLNSYISNQKESFQSSFFLIIFPTSLFLVAPYTESLFLLLWSIAFLAAFKNNWIVSGIAAGFASFTRNFGILILPALLVQWYLNKDRKNKDLFFIVVPTVITVGIYLMINYHFYGDPLAFQKILENHWQKRLFSPIESFLNVWQIALSGQEIDQYKLTVGWSEGMALLIVFLLSPIAYKKLPPSLFVYHILSLILISSTSFILSTPRYIMSIPTVFIVLSKILKTETVIKIYEFISIGGLFYLTYLYTMGHWAF